MSYQVVSKVALPGFELTYGSERIGLLEAWNQKRLYIGPIATSSDSGVRASHSIVYPPTPPCSHCGGKTGCLYCQKSGGKSRRRFSTRRRRNN